MSFVADLSALVAASVDHRHSCPEGWSRVPLGSVAKIINGFPFKSGGFGAIGHPVIRIRDVTRGFTNTRFDGDAPAGFWVEAGDLIVGMDGDFQTAFWRSDPALLNQRVCKLVPDQTRIDRRYLAYILPGYLELINANTPSVTVKHLSSKTLASIPLPLPPLARQRAIADRIDELFAEIDDGEAALARARDDLATWRKALLKAAVTGELTADWRAANPSSESGAELLARVAADLPPRKPRKPGAPSRAGESAAMPFTVPSNWAWTTLDQIINSGPTNGYSPKRSTDGEGTQALKLTATTAGRLKLDPNCVKVLSETIPAGSPLYLKSGDLLFQRGNTREYVGMAAVYDGPPNKYIYPDLMIRVTMPDEALTQWAWRWAVSPHGRHYLMDAAQGGAGTMPKISGQILRSMPVPLPPATELKFILAELERLTAETEAGHYDLSLASVTPATLRQSILAAAFRGELA